ncbi:hypothetical protein CR152_20255 [Massilia violaceinigra]|uniref:Uncharacterized protein n=1 Tax=Massilia violaceinigra TaxID=2045208 RepID=A0A2D2DNP0_9BURK|nr:hypothetical protein CR152_20255 [Massilia violaceinigra]
MAVAGALNADGMEPGHAVPGLPIALAVGQGVPHCRGAGEGRTRVAAGAHRFAARACALAASQENQARLREDLILARRRFAPYTGG